MHSLLSRFFCLKVLSVKLGYEQRPRRLRGQRPLFSVLSLSITGLIERVPHGCESRATFPLLDRMRKVRVSTISLTRIGLLALFPLVVFFKWFNPNTYSKFKAWAEQYEYPESSSSLMGKTRSWTIIR